MQNYKFNYVKVLLKKANIPSTDRKVIMKDYYALLKMKLIQLSDISDEDIDRILLIEDEKTQQTELDSLINASLKDNKKLQEEFYDFVQDLNLKFFAIIAQTMDDSQKKEMIEYLDEYSKRATAYLDALT
ncbi:hypothetical protein KC660_00385 [Candidatus Dojkabacteria bacterium]|uniref:Uncharacterized protein n=1 Tax=Candidatus Dojkabacteria bacterium TaxID=2099670 RepID=A0A955L2R8_9BACT|nr:hypothetical protein [Candidatus Dojkabacteria bacterium]